MFGAALERGPAGQIGTGLGQTTSTGTVSLIAPTDTITATGETRVIDGIRMEFQNTPGTEAPAEMNTLFPDHGALWMAENATLAHADLSDLRRRCAASGAAENVAFFSGGDLDAATALKAWMGSPGHRANILGPELTHLGVGVARTSGGAWYLTQDFLRAG